MIQSEQAIPISWAWVAGAALLAIGIAWGALSVRVRSVEKIVDGFGSKFDKIADELTKLRELLARRQ